jgi:hypothetical protein
MFQRGAENPAAERPASFKSFLTPTPEEYRSKTSQVAPLQKDAKTVEPSRATVCLRPSLEGRTEVEKALESCRTRSPRLPLVDEDKVRDLIGADAPAGPLPQWVRLLANFPRDGKNRIVSLRAAEEKGDLTPLRKAQVSWIIARQDRAWYAAGEAQRRLRQLGQTGDQIYQLDGDWSGFSPGDRALFTVARKLGASPVVLTDADVDEALTRTGPREVVQLISYVTDRAFFDRLTEAAALQLEK